MKSRSFHISFGNLDDLAHQAKIAMTSENKVEAKHAAIFADLNDFMSFMFPSKFILLMMIKSKSISSMYELAQLVGRSQSGVLRDCRELEAMGFINLTHVGPRNAMRPSLSFDYNRLVVHTDAGDCYHVFPSAA